MACVAVARVVIMVHIVYGAKSAALDDARVAVLLVRLLVDGGDVAAAEAALRQASGY